MHFLFYQDYLRMGGTECHTVHLAARLQEQNHRVTLLTNRPGGRLLSTVNTHSIRHRSLQPLDSRINFFSPGLLSTIRRIAPDVIALMGRVANEAGSKLIHTFPNIPVISSLRTGRPITRTYQRTLRASKITITNSEWASTRAIDLGVDPSRIRLVYNPLLKPPPPLTSECARLRESIRKQTACPPEKRVFLTVASFVPGKNQENLLGLIYRMTPTPDAQFWFVGEGPRLYACKKLVQKLGLNQKVFFWGYKSDVTPFFCAADFALSASLEESLPNSLIEAQYYGLPVIAYDEAGTAECFDPGNTGILIPRDQANQLANSIQEAANGRLFPPDIAPRCHSFASARFDPERQTRLWIDCVLEFATMLSFRQ